MQASMRSPSDSRYDGLRTAPATVVSPWSMLRRIRATDRVDGGGQISVQALTVAALVDHERESLRGQSLIAVALRTRAVARARRGGGHCGAGGVG